MIGCQELLVQLLSLLGSLLLLLKQDVGIMIDVKPLQSLSGVDNFYTNFYLSKLQFEIAKNVFKKFFPELFAWYAW